MKKFVFIAAVLGFTNVFVAMTQQKNSPIPLHNNGIETFTVYEADGSNYCYNGGRGATSCSISGGIDIKGGGASAACDVSCQTGYYACCGIRCTCRKILKCMRKIVILSLGLCFFCSLAKENRKMLPKG